MITLISLEADRNYFWLLQVSSCQRFLQLTSVLRLSPFPKLSLHFFFNLWLNSSIFSPGCGEHRVKWQEVNNYSQIYIISNYIRKWRILSLLLF